MLLILVGCSSSGKDTLVKKLINELGYESAISHTSRPMRKGETQGVEYNFITYKQIVEMEEKGKLIESRHYNTIDGEWIYGLSTTAIDFEKNMVVIVDFEGLKQMNKWLYKNNKIHLVTSFYIHCDAQERLKRSITREGNMSDSQVMEVCRRLLDDEEKVVPACAYCDYIFDNTDEKQLENFTRYVKKRIGE